MMNEGCTIDYGLYIFAKNVEEFKEIISQLGYPIVIIMACGGKLTLNSMSDIPLVEVPCSCQNKNHWFIGNSLTKD